MDNIKGIFVPIVTHHGYGVLSKFENVQQEYSTWKRPMVLTTACLTAGVQLMLYSARKWLDTATRASFGHLWNQFIVHPDINPGNFNERLRNFSPTCY